jgi:hypothetical protein
MKKLNLILVALLALAACKKDNTGTPSNGTITPATKIIGQSVADINFSAQDSLTSLNLMKENNLSTEGFVFYSYESYNAIDQNNQAGFYQLATAVQVRNGLPVFFYDITFGFDNGKLVGTYPAPQFIAGAIALDNKPNLTLQALRDTFIKTDNAREAYNISIGDSTLVSQLGYYNLNINKMPVGGTPDYIKAWYVHPQHSPWPQGYFRDDTGAPISFQPVTHSGPVFP